MKVSQYLENCEKDIKLRNLKELIHTAPNTSYRILINPTQWVIFEKRVKEVNIIEVTNCHCDNEFTLPLKEARRYLTCLNK